MIENTPKPMRKGRPLLWYDTYSSQEYRLFCAETNKNDGRDCGEIVGTLGCEDIMDVSHCITTVARRADINHLVHTRRECRLNSKTSEQRVQR